jgi:MoaA/NifB/PqqE/SkfB family radical SAM enzyme
MGIAYLQQMARIFMKVASSYTRRRTRLDYLPPVFWVEPTNHCNLQCAMCPNSVIERGEGGYLPLADYGRLVDEISRHYPHGGATLALFLSGEPLLHPDIFKMVAYARQRGLNVNLATNATLLTAEVVQELLAAPPSLLIISFDGYDAPSYEKARTGASFAATLANIHRFLAQKRQRGVEQPRVRLYSLILDSTRSAQERQRFEAFFAGEFTAGGIDEFLIEEAGNWAGLFSGEQGDGFVPKVTRGERYYPCIRAWDSMSIRWDGSVVACCADFTGSVVLGNIRDKSLLEIWNDTPFQRFRQRLITGELAEVPLCAKGCDMLYPQGVVWGLPRELQLHRKLLRDLKSRLRARYGEKRQR